MPWSLRLLIQFLNQEISVLPNRYQSRCRENKSVLLHCKICAIASMGPRFGNRGDKNYSFGDDSDQHQALNKIKDALKFIEDERLTYLVVENTDPIFEDME
jgi:hypothetical protein